MNIAIGQLEDLGEIRELWLEGNAIFAGAPHIFQGGDFEDIENAVQYGTALVSRHGGQVTGFIVYRLLGDQASLTHLIVEKGRRGGGVGTALVKAAGKRAAEYGATKVVGLTWPENGVHHLYEKVGYKIIGYVVGAEL